MSKEIKIVAAEYLLSGDSPTQLFPEIAIVGRSNAGKSSLINLLCERKNLVRTSKTPGQTRTLNFFKITTQDENQFRRDFFLVDFPGYGFASRSMKERKSWAENLVDFLDAPQRIQRLVLVMEIRRDPEEAELEILSSSLGREILIVATKSDKLKRREIQARCSAIASALSVDNKDVFPTSSLSREGIPELQARVFKEITLR